MAQKTTDKVLKTLTRGLKDNLGKEQIEGIAKKVNTAAKSKSKGGVWSDIGKSISSGKMTGSTVRDLFTKDSINMIKDSKPLDDISDTLKKRLPKALDAGDVRKVITENAPENLRESARDFAKTVTPDSKDIERLASANKGGLLGDALSNYAGSSGIDKVDSGALNKILDAQSADRKIGSNLTGMGRDRLNSLKSNRHNSPSDMAKYNVANKARNVSDASDLELTQLGRSAQQRMSSPTVRDNLAYHKMPEKAAGVASTAFLVQNLASKRGQLSNAELFNPTQQQGQGQNYY